MPNPRYRNYSFILYPESEDFKEYNWVKWLESKHVPCLAIQHDPEEEGEKVHVHVLAHFDSPQPRKNVMEIYKHENIPCNGSLEFFSPVSSVRGLERYFLHLDQPEKIQYSPTLLYQLCGYVNHLDSDNDTASPVRVLYSMARDSPNYKVFLVRVSDNRPDLLGYVASHCYFFMSLYI